MSDKDDLIYDEDDSVAFIQNYLPQENSVMTILIILWI